VTPNHGLLWIALTLSLWCDAAVAAGDDGGVVLARYSFGADHFTQWKLPKRLREASGLTLTDAGALLVHDDERAVIYQIDYTLGSVVKTFALGNPPVRGDFEGIAAVADAIYLMTSDGVLLRSVEGHYGQRLAFERFDTGLSHQCELEGLTFDAERRDLLLACKQPRAKALEGQVAVYRWSVESRRLGPAPILIDARAVASRLGTKGFNPSALAIADGHLILLAAKQQALLETDMRGSIVSALRLPLAKRHAQPEGLAIAADGRLIIADEGGTRRARIGVYQPDS